MTNLYKSAEDYLETILLLKEKLGNVRSIDIVNELGFSKPSVSVAMKKLRESNHITMDKDGYINLTELGIEAAQSVLRKHKVLTEFLILLGVDETIAKEDACKLEHGLSDVSFDKLRLHVKKLK